MKKIMNKKGLIIGDVFGAIAQTIQTITRTFPKPVLFFLFLLIIVGIGIVLQSLLGIFGIFCNSADRPMTTNFNIINNMILLGNLPDSSLAGLNVLNPEEFSYTVISKEVTKCSRNIRNAVVEYDNGSNYTISGGNTEWFYDGQYCTDCDLVYVWEYNPDFTMLSGSGAWCKGNVFRIDDSKKSAWKRMVCGAVSCEPPEHYYYAPQRNLYVCDDTLCEGRTLGQSWDELLIKNNAKPMYPEGDIAGINIDKFVGIKCESMRPKIAIYGIQIFDYRIWVVIMIISIMLWALIRFG